MSSLRLMAAQMGASGRLLDTPPPPAGGSGAGVGEGLGYVSPVGRRARAAATG